MVRISRYSNFEDKLFFSPQDVYRYFGKNADDTSLYIKNVVEEYNRNNMASYLKHFP